MAFEGEKKKKPTHHTNTPTKSRSLLRKVPRPANLSVLRGSKRSRSGPQTSPLKKMRPTPAADASRPPRGPERGKAPSGWAGRQEGGPARSPPAWKKKAGRPRERGAPSGGGLSSPLLLGCSSPAGRGAALSPRGQAQRQAHTRPSRPRQPPGLTEAARARWGESRPGIVAAPEAPQIPPDHRRFPPPPARCCTSRSCMR